MRLVVDSSSVISLHVSGVLDELFILTSEVYTTDLVANELKDPTAISLTAKGLKILSLTDAELNQAEHLAYTNAEVSLQDVSVIILAQRLNAILLADDKPLRNLASNKALSVHGSLWALEQLVAHQQITTNQLCEALQRMLNSGRRLPQSAVQQIRRQYGCKAGALPQNTL